MLSVSIDMTFLSTPLFLVGLLAAGTLGAVTFMAHDPAEPCGAVVGGAGAFAGSGAGCAASAAICPEGPSEPFATPQDDAAAGTIRFEVESRGHAVAASVCLVDDHGVKRHEEGGRLAGGTTAVFDVAVPRGTYDGVIRIRTLGDGGGETVVQSRLDVSSKGCPGGAVVMPATVSSETGNDLTLQGHPDRCVERSSLEPDEGAAPMRIDAGLPPLGPGVVERAGWGLVAFSFGLAAFSGSVYALRSEPSRWLWAGLFSRIRRPKALDQAVRAEIHTVIGADPGVRAEEIRRRLALAAGQTAHHLRVLVDTGLVTRVRVGGAAHHFPSGRWPPDEMRRRALLRAPSSRHVYDVLRTEGEADVSAVARASGLSVPYVSRLTARLADAGLVERRRAGRRVLLRARSHDIS